MMSSPEPNPDSIAVAWQRVEEHWQDEAEHQRFVALCAAQGALAEAGRRYREVRDRDPERRAEAEKRLNAVLGAAFATLDSARTRGRPPRSKLFFIGCGVGVSLLGYVLFAVLRRLLR